jgi:uncharacterized protein (DUF1778 family)
MRSDYRRAVKNLQIALHGVTRAMNQNTLNYAAFSARVFALTAILFEDPLVKQARQEIESRRHDVKHVFESWLSSLEARLNDAFRHLIEVASNVVEHDFGDSALAAAVDSAKDWFCAQRDTLIEYAEASIRSTTYTYNEKDLLSGILPSEIASQLQQCYEFTTALGEHLYKPLSASAEPAEPNVLALAQALSRVGTIGHKSHAAHDWFQISDLLSRMRLDVLSQLQEFHEAARSLLAGRADFPLKRDGYPLIAPSFILWELESAVEMIISHLDAGAQRLYVLDRMKVFFEHFGYEDLRARIRTKGKRKIEDVIQDEMEKFIFLEGLFPLVHSEAARGSLDALLERYGAAEGPVLIELKQCINIGSQKSITATSVRNKIAEGRRQAAIYSGHVRSNTEWRDVDPVIVVFYNSPAPMVFEQDENLADVWLIYVGKGNPSRARPAKDGAAPTRKKRSSRKRQKAQGSSAPAPP